VCWGGGGFGGFFFWWVFLGWVFFCFFFAEKRTQRDSEEEKRGPGRWKGDKNSSSQSRLLKVRKKKGLKSAGEKGGRERGLHQETPQGENCTDIGGGGFRGQSPGRVINKMDYSLNPSKNGGGEYVKGSRVMGGEKRQE